MSDLEARLRTAVRTEADRIEPDETASLGTIRARVRTARRRRRALGGSIVVLVVAAAVLLSPRLGDRGQEVDMVDRTDPSTTTSRPDTTTTTGATTPTTTATAPSTTAAPPTSEATTPVAEEPAAEGPTMPATPVLWPGPGHPGFTDPVAAAGAFTRDAIGFGDPALSAFRAGPAPGGEIDVHHRGEDGRPLASVASTLSLLEHEGRWYVTGARSAIVVVDSPGAASRVGSPLTVQGRGHGFEGTIHVEVRAAFAPTGQVLARTTTTAGGLEQLEPYSATLTFPASPGSAGAVVVTNDTGLAGGTVSFTALPVTFG